MFEICLLVILVVGFIAEVARRLYRGETLFLSDEEIMIILILIPVMVVLVIKGIIS